MKAPGLVRRKKQTGEGTLVMASPSAVNRGSWIRRLQASLAVCEVTDRRVLERVMIDLQPGILVMDLALPGLRGVRSLRGIRELSPSTRIVVLSEAPTEREGLFALKAGASGYCARSIDDEHLEKAVAAVQKGEIWAPRNLVPGLIAELRLLIDSRTKEDLQRAPNPRLDTLTARQRAVADLIGRGAGNKEIATRLRISERTVKAHLTEVFRNLGVSDRLQLALFVKGHPLTPG